MTGMQLHRLQSSYSAEAGRLQEEWAAAPGATDEEKQKHVKYSTYRKPCASGLDVFDIQPFQNDPAIWLDVLEAPRVVSLLTQLIGSDVSCSEYSARTVPGPDGESGYTTWYVKSELIRIGMVRTGTY